MRGAERGESASVRSRDLATCGASPAQFRHAKIDCVKPHLAQTSQRLHSRNNSVTHQNLVAFWIFLASPEWDHLQPLIRAGERPIRTSTQSILPAHLQSLSTGHDYHRNSSAFQPTSRKNHGLIPEVRCVSRPSGTRRR